MRKSNFSIYGNFLENRGISVTAFQPPDTQPITYNTFSNRAFLTQNFVYQRFTHYNFLYENVPRLLKHPAYKLELGHNIIMNRRQLIQTVYWLNDLGGLCSDVANWSLTDEEYEEFSQDAHAWLLLAAQIAWIL